MWGLVSVVAVAVLIDCALVDLVIVCRFGPELVFALGFDTVGLFVSGVRYGFFVHVGLNCPFFSKHAAGQMVQQLY